MKNTFTIAGREFRGYFNGPVAYIVVCIVLLLLGIFFWNTFFLMGKATVRDMFSLLTMFLILAAPAMTMGLLAEEKRTGTIELLITMPVRDAEVILGKFLGVLGLFAVLLAVTLAYPISVKTLGNLDWGPVWGGYMGIFLEGAAMLSIGLLASSWTNNQLIALIVGAAICFVFWIVDRLLPFLPQGASSVFQWISFNYHFESMSHGVIDTRDVIYFLSIIGFALSLAFRSLESRRWR